MKKQKPACPIASHRDKRVLSVQKTFPETGNNISTVSRLDGRRGESVFPHYPIHHSQPQFAFSRVKIPSMRDFWLSGAMFRAI